MQTQCESEFFPQRLGFKITLEWPPSNSKFSKYNLMQCPLSRKKCLRFKNRKHKRKTYKLSTDIVIFQELTCN